PEAALLLVIVGRSWAPDVAAAAALTTKPLAEAEDAGVLGPAELRALLAPPHRVDVAGRGDLDAIETPTACRPTRFLGPASGVRRSLLGRGPAEAAFAQLAPALPFLSLLTTPDDVAHLVDAEAFGAVRRCHGCPSLSGKTPGGAGPPRRTLRCPGSRRDHISRPSDPGGKAPWDVRPGCRTRGMRVAPDVEGSMRKALRLGKVWPFLRFHLRRRRPAPTFSPCHHQRCPERRLPNRWENPRGLFTTAGRTAPSDHPFSGPSSSPPPGARASRVWEG